MSIAIHLSHFCSTTTSCISLPHRISCKHQLALSVSATAHHSFLFHTIASLILQRELRAAPSLSHLEQHYLTLPSCSTAHHTLTPQHAHLHRGPEALPLTHHNHIYSRHPTPFSCSSAVQCHNHTLLEGRICPPLLKISPILYHKQLISLTSASLNARKRMSTPQVPPVHRLGIPHELRSLARWQTPSRHTASTSALNFPSLYTKRLSAAL